ncbi:MAG: hypothetical protein WCP53_07940, partial [Verrucomicrobiota bacterium]
GGPTAVFSYGWAEFEVEAASQSLVVTTYGIPAYTAAQMGPDVLLRTPVPVSRFTVQPEAPRLSAVRVGGQVRLSWSAAYPDHRLEQSPRIDGAAPWQTVPHRAEGDERVAEVAVEDLRFFRLRQP